MKRVQTWVALVILVAIASAPPLSAQSAAWRLVQISDGSLYLIRDGVRQWIVPAPISDDELAAIPEVDPLLDGQLPTPPAPASAPDESSATATPVPIAASQPQLLQGQGKSVSRKFTLSEGLTVFKLQHSGRSNFIVRLLSESGQRIGSLANEIGNYRGSTATGVQAGTYVLDIDADGAWTVAVEEPRATDAPGLPRQFSGQGDFVTEFFTLPEGLVTVRLQHTGRSNFIVKLLDANGNRAGGSWANEIGAFEGTKAVGVQASGFSDARPGVHVLVIDADGDWAITID